MRARLDALQDEMRHPVRERVGLAGAGAGDDEQRPGPEGTVLVTLAIPGGPRLGGIQAVEGGCDVHSRHYRRYLYESPVPGERSGARRGAEEGSAEPRSRGPIYGDATVEPIIGASFNADPFARLRGQISTGAPLPPVDAPPMFCVGICPAAARIGRYDVAETLQRPVKRPIRALR